MKRLEDYMDECLAEEEPSADDKPDGVPKSVQEPIVSADSPPYVPPLPIPLCIMCGQRIDFVNTSGETQIFVVDVELDELTVPDIEAMVRGK